MALGRRKRKRQSELWDPAAHVAAAPGHPFYEQLKQLLAETKPTSTAVVDFWYDTSGPTDALLRTVKYTYYDTGQPSNITVGDEQLDPNGHQRHYDLSLTYYTNGMLRPALWGKYKLDAQTGEPDQSTYAAVSSCSPTRPRRARCP